MKAWHASLCTRQYELSLSLLLLAGLLLGQAALAAVVSHRAIPTAVVRQVKGVSMSCSIRRGSQHTIEYSNTALVTSEKQSGTGTPQERRRKLEVV